MTEKNLAGCVIYNEHGQVLMLHRQTSDVARWELPGGKQDKDESLEITATREVDEELGIRVKIIRAMGHAPFTDSNVLWDYHWFEAEIINGIPRVMEPHLFDEVAYKDLDLAKKRSKDFSINVLNLIDALKNR